MHSVSVREVFYSPLCDSSDKAYGEYLAFCTEVLKHGRCQFFGGVSGGEFVTAGRITGVDGGSGCGVVVDEVSSSESSGFSSGSGCGGPGDVGAVGGVDHGGVAVSSGGSGVEGLVSGGVCGVVVGDVVGAVGGGSESVSSESGGKVVPSAQVAVGVGGGPFLGRNRRGRQRRKEKLREKKKRAVTVGVEGRGDEVPEWRRGAGFVASRPLSATWVERKDAENRLATARALKELELQQARDIGAEAEKLRVCVLRDTEKGRVAVEKAHSTLKATGNVAGVVPGFCETVVSDGSAGSVPGLSNGESISPDSSASMHEFRKVQKESLDKDARIRELECQVRGFMFDRCERVAVTVANSEEDMDAKVEGLFRQFVTGKHDGIDYVGGDEGTLFVRKSVYIPAEGDEASLDDERFNYPTV